MLNRALWIAAGAWVCLGGCSGADGRAQTDCRVGVLLPATGSLAELSNGMEAGYQLAQEEVNQAGGIFCGYLHVELRNSGGVPEVAARSMEQLLASRVPLIIGPQESSSVLAVVEQVTTGATPILSNAAIAPAISVLVDDDLVFRTVPSGEAHGKAIASEMYADGHRRVGILAADSSDTVAVAAAFEKAFRFLGGRVVSFVTYQSDPPDDYDYQSRLDAVMTAGPEAIFLAAFPVEGTRFLSTWSSLPDYRFVAWYLSDALRLSAVAENVGPARVEGMKGVSFSEPDVAFRERIGSGFGVELLRAHHAYDAFILAALALHRAGSLEGLAVRDALREVAGPPGQQVPAGRFAEALQLLDAGADIDYQGASGLVDFDGNGDVAGLVEIWTFQNGRPVPKKFFMGD